MARPTKTPTDRAKDVIVAAALLPALIAEAATELQIHGAADPRVIALWEQVETHGATIHRQSRLLAGKARGG